MSRSDFVSDIFVSVITKLAMTIGHQEKDWRILSVEREKLSIQLDSAKKKIDEQSREIMALRGIVK